MGLSLDVLDPPLDDIAFLSRSNHRVRVLEALAGGDLTRGELRDVIGTSQPTLGRVLDGFQERGWATENGRGYALTPFGRLLADEFGGLMDTVETIQQLRELAPRLPLEEMDFDLRLLAQSTITTPSPTDASAHFRRESDLLPHTERIRFLCNQAQPETVETYRDWVIERGGHLEAIIAGDAIDAASAHPSMGACLRDLLGSDRVTIHRYDGPVSIMLGRLDDTASIVPLDDAGVPCAFIESGNESVRAWVADTLDSYQERAERVVPGDLPR
jgi:predicted transcriptional regulator